MENRNISIAKKNGYSFEKVMKAKQYLEEIGNNKRTFPFEKLVTMYNDIYGTHDSTSGCRCQSPKYYNGLQNYFKYGKLTLINNGLAKESDFELEKPKVEEIAENRINLGDVDNDKVEPIEESGEQENEPQEKKKAGRPKKKE